MLYNEDQIRELKKKSRKYLIVSSVVLGVILAGFIVSLFFVNDDSIRLIQIIGSVLLSLAVCFFLYVIFNILLPDSRRQKLVNRLLNAEEKAIECDVVSIGKLRTVDHEIKIIEVEIKTDEGKSTVFLDTGFESLKNGLDGHLFLKVRDRYIVEIIK